MIFQVWDYYFLTSNLVWHWILNMIVFGVTSTTWILYCPSHCTCQCRAIHACNFKSIIIMMRPDTTKHLFNRSLRNASFFCFESFHCLSSQATTQFVSVNETTCNNKRWNWETYKHLFQSVTQLLTSWLDLTQLTWFKLCQWIIQICPHCQQWLTWFEFVVGILSCQANTLCQKLFNKIYHSNWQWF